jgi:hypothetical protein
MENDDKLKLKDAVGRTVFSVNYGNHAPWSELVDGFGFTLVPRNLSSAKNQDNAKEWRSSASANGGSPGADDAGLPAARKIPLVLNEVRRWEELFFFFLFRFVRGFFFFWCFGHLLLFILRLIVVVVCSFVYLFFFPHQLPHRTHAQIALSQTKGQCWVELYNPSTASTSLFGWRFSNSYDKADSSTRSFAYDQPGDSGQTVPASAYKGVDLPTFIINNTEGMAREHLCT